MLIFFLFGFSNQFIWLGLDSKFQPKFLDLDFNISVVFVNTSQCYLHLYCMFATQWPNSWAVIYLVKLVPKTFAAMPKARFTHAQLTSIIVLHGGLGARKLGKEIKK